MLDDDFIWDIMDRARSNPGVVRTMAKLLDLLYGIVSVILSHVSMEFSFLTVNFPLFVWDRKC